MELKRIMINNTFFLSIIAVLFFLLHGESFCKELYAAQSIKDKASSNKSLIIKITKDTSLYELITKSGYSIDDRDVVSFLRDFMNMNENVKGISALKKGIVVKVPLRNLRKVEAGTVKLHEKTETPARKRSLIKKAETEKTVTGYSLINRAMILRNIKLLSDSLDKKILIEMEGFKLFNINERSTLSLDASFFPLINFNKERILVLDLSGILPEEVKDLVEVTWPEYRVVSYRGELDLKKIIGFLLESMGYSVNSDGKIIIGGRTQIEYDADFLIFLNSDDLMNNEISVIGIIGMNEFGTPENTIEWLKKREINLIELSYNEVKKHHGKASKVVDIELNKDEKEFTENILSLMGYKFSRDSVFNLSDRKEYSYNLKAALSINLGYRSKLIEFTELSDYEIKFAQKRGFDIISVKTWEERKTIIHKIISLLSLNFKNSPRTTSPYITPPGVKYRLLSPGVFVHSINGPMFITDSEFDTELLRQLIDENVTIVKF